MATLDTIVDEFGNMLTEAETLLKRAAQTTGDEASTLRTEVQAKLLTAKLRLQELEGKAVDAAKVAGKAADDYVHEKPWQAVGIAAGVGLLVGLLLGRR